MAREAFPLRSGKRTRGNVLFYNLDTPDLIGNKYPRSSRGCCVGWRGRDGSAGLCWPRTAPAGTTRLRRGVKCLGGCAGCWSIRRQKDSPVFFVFLPNLPPGARVRCQTGDPGGPGAGMGWFAVLCGAPEGSQLPWDAAAGAKPLHVPPSSCCTPRWRSFGADTLLCPIPRAGVGVGGAGGDAVTCVRPGDPGHLGCPCLPRPSLPSVPGSLKV